jgi:hypothetical protein
MRDRSERAPSVAIPTIGACLACRERGRLDDGFCRTCLDSPYRGRRWAEAAVRIRREAAFARLVYDHVKTPKGRALFVRLFGWPEGLGAVDLRGVLPLALLGLCLASSIAGCRSELAPLFVLTAMEEPTASDAKAALTRPEPTPDPTSAAPRESASARVCARAPKVSPEELAASWPSRLGQRVRMKARIEQAVDLTHAIVRAGSKHFSVLLTPDQSFAGEQERTFTVFGSTTVLIPGGPQTVVELMLEADDCADR